MFFKEKKKEAYSPEDGALENEEDFIPSGALEGEENEEYETSKSYEEERGESSGMSGGFSADSKEGYDAGSSDYLHRNSPPPIRNISLTRSSPNISQDKPASFSALSESPDAIVMEFRKLDDKINSIVEWIKQFYDRFSPAVDSLGSLRNMTFENERNIGRALKDSARAIEIASKIDLEKLRMDSKKSDVDIEANKQEIARLFEDVRNLNERASVFVSTEELLKLNEEVKNSLAQIKSIDSEIRARADRMEKIRRESGSAVEIKKEIEKSEALIQRTAILAKQNNESLGNFTFEDYQEKIDTILEVIEKMAQEISEVKKDLSKTKEELSYQSTKKKNEAIEALESIGEIPELPELPSSKIKKIKKNKKKR